MTNSFLYDSSTGTISDLGSLLPKSGWTNVLVQGMSSDGTYITGQGTHNSAAHAFLITSTTGPNTPEQSEFPTLGDPIPGPVPSLTPTLLSAGEVGTIFAGAGLDPTGSLVPAQEFSSRTPAPMAAVGDLALPVPSTSFRGAVFAAPDMDWLGNFTPLDNGMATEPAQ
jgi:hypothetical protein